MGGEWLLGFRILAMSVYAAIWILTYYRWGDGIWQIIKHNHVMSFFAVLLGVIGAGGMWFVRKPSLALLAGAAVVALSIFVYCGFNKTVEGRGTVVRTKVPLHPLATDRETWGVTVECAKEDVTAKFIGIPAGIDDKIKITLAVDNSEEFSVGDHVQFKTLLLDFVYEALPEAAYPETRVPGAFVRVLGK